MLPALEQGCARTLEKKFREEVFKWRGMKKGNITLAIQVAIRMWIEAQRERRSEIAKKAWEARKEKLSRAKE